MNFLRYLAGNYYQKWHTKKNFDQMENYILKAMQKYILTLFGLKKMNKRGNSITQLKTLAVCLTKHRNFMRVFWNCRRTKCHWLPN